MVRCPAVSALRRLSDRAPSRAALPPWSRSPAYVLGSDHRPSPNQTHFRGMSIFYDHHIIPERFRGHAAFHRIDKQVFDIDSPANRIYLPADQKLAAKLRVSPHSGRHVPSYSQTVGEKLDKIAAIPDPSDRAAEIRTLIDAMRVALPTAISTQICRSIKQDRRLTAATRESSRITKPISVSTRNNSGRSETSSKEERRPGWTI